MGKRVKLTLASALLVLFGLADSARASSFYYEVEGGLAQIHGGNPFFGVNAPASADMGVAFNFTVAYSFAGDAPADLQLGVQYRLATGANNGNEYYGLQTAYPIARLQLSKAFITLGASPFTWRRVSPSAGLDFFSSATGSIALLGECGALWSVSPEFSLGAVGAAEYVQSSGTQSPSPVFEVTALMRFYFGFGSSGGGSASAKSSNEFKGWRYPMGWPH